MTFGVGFHKETTEVGNESVNFVGFGLPPGGDIFIERIGRWQAALAFGRGEIRRKIQANAVRPPNVSQCGNFSQVIGSENPKIGVDVINGDGVKAERSVGASVIGIAGAQLVGQFVPLPEGAAGVAALDGAIQVVPMVDHPYLDFGTICDVEMVNRLAGLKQAQQMECAVQRAKIAVRSDGDNGMAADLRRADDESFGAKLAEVFLPIQVANGVGRFGRADDNSAVLYAVLFCWCGAK